jgi:hypothetical protein
VYGWKSWKWVEWRDGAPAQFQPCQLYLLCPALAGQGQRCDGIAKHDTYLDDAGFGRVVIQQNLGHADVKMTLGYIGELDAGNRRSPPISSLTSRA